jgi:hypothetical protein
MAIRSEWSSCNMAIRYEWSSCNMAIRFEWSSCNMAIRSECVLYIVLILRDTVEVLKQRHQKSRTENQMLNHYTSTYV